MRNPRRRRNDQQGFALLFVFALAASIACVLYLEIPRVAFEAQRSREELLMSRGKEYIRGVQLFVRKNQRAPQNLDELEKFQNIRFLRRRYKDPMTGQDEWRLIHADANGQLVDSLIQKKEEGSTSVLAASIQGIGASAEVIGPGGQTGNAALRPRASDRINAPTSGEGQPDNPAPPEGGQVITESRSGPVPPQGPLQGFPGMPGGAANSQQGGVVPQPGAPPNIVGGIMRNPPVAPGQSSQASSSNQPPTQQQQPQSAFGGGGFGGSSAFGNPGSGNTGAANQPNQPNQQNPFQRPAMGGVTTPGSSGNIQPNNDAMRMIQNLLTQPRPAPAGLNRGAGPVMGAGLVGVASKKDGVSIKVYKDRTNYKEWEFVYDRQADVAGQQAKMMPAQQGTNPQGGTNNSPRPPSPFSLGGRPPQ